VVSVVGKSNVGKTTFLEKLIRELKRRGYRVGTIKHKAGNKPKIEVVRRAVAQGLLSAESELLAIVTDQPYAVQVPQYGLDDAAGVADLLESRFLKS
jgi:molybdopterin-guanine dinucleotide biosynthesis protein